VRSRRSAEYDERGGDGGGVRGGRTREDDDGRSPERGQGSAERGDGGSPAAQRSPSAPAARCARHAPQGCGSATCARALKYCQNPLSEPAAAR